MINLIKENYETYINARSKLRESHFLRLVFFLTVSITVAVLADTATNDIYNMMTTGLTILTGFTFTALFSDHALADVGLAAPSNETDRQDINRLTTLGKNFQARSKYFIALSIIDVCALISLSVDLTTPKPIITLAKKLAYATKINFGNMQDVLIILHEIATYILVAFAIFLFLECLHTFYRLTETIMAIVNGRRSYMRPNTE